MKGRGNSKDSEEREEARTILAKTIAGPLLTFTSCYLIFKTILGDGITVFILLMR